MIRMSLGLLFSLCISAFNAFAVSDSDQIGYSEIEAQERLQIINELTYRLDTKFACNQNLIWDDGGSGANLDGYFFIPSVGQAEYIIGGLASQKKTSAKNCVITVSEPSNNPKGTPRLLATPIDWNQVWNDKGSGARKDGSIWEAIPPDSNYRCLGSIPQLGYNKPNVPNYRCVHKSLTEKVVTNSIAWHDKGSGANVDATMFRLPNTGTFVTVAKRLNKTRTYDLNANATGEPDPQIVESILSKRMVQIKADLEIQLKAKFKQQKKEAEQKQLTEEDEQYRSAKVRENLAEEAKQDLLDREAKQKQLAEAKEQVRLAEEVEQARIEEEAKQIQLAHEAEHKILIEEAEQKRLTEESNKTESTFKNSSEANIGNDSNNSKDTTNSSIPYLAGLLFVIGIILLVITGRYIISIVVNGKSSSDASAVPTDKNLR